MKPEVDWAALHKYPAAEIACHCGAVYRSHAKGVIHEGKFTSIVEVPCPKCGEDLGNARRISHEPEVVEIRG